MKNSTEGSVKTVWDVYDFVDLIRAECKTGNELELFDALGRALGLGSSGLEILGGIELVFRANRKKIIKLPNVSAEKVDAVMAFIRRAYTD